ncbi:baseplate J/gp47 family protein [Agathobaculum sp. LCP25S3_E8]|uniref:baseplate J/gp47 family protein n=1 Tax=Agathobaculum sp. LCP25S3_E8 TaxID=3438735 RepID=UPI003F908D40
MLHSIKLNDQDYEQLLGEALSRIPLYTNEWTNFNVSDPGVTILENLSSFSLLQQSLLDEVTDELRFKLLSLLGLHPSGICAAHLLVAPEDGGGRILPAQEKLLLGSMCFETREQTELIPWSMMRVIYQSGGETRDLTYLLQYGAHASVQMFGASPQPGDAVYFILSGELHAGMTLHFYAGIENESWRNPFDADDSLSFARMRWQYYTAEGWMDAACEDETHGFLLSGGLHLTLGQEAPVEWDGFSAKGIAVRCVLEQAEYDIAPRVRSLVGGLFEVEQRETHAASFRFAGADEIRIQSAMTRYENLFVYCRERENGPYFRYELDRGEGQGRFYLRQDELDGTVVLHFDHARFGFGPDTGPDAICAVCYDLDTLHRRRIGTAYGYEDQQIELTDLQAVLSDGFSVLAELVLPDGQIGYYRITPNDRREESLYYTVEASDGALHIHHNGMSGAVRLYLCDAATTAGEAGNLRAGARLNAAPDPYFPHEPSEVFYHAPGRGVGGRSAETAEQLRRRLIEALRCRSSAVSEADYEQAVRTTPGLCIHKVRAVADERHNLVRLTVKCYTENDKPVLPAYYVEKITQRLEQYHMIATRIELRQPQYVPIDVTAVVHVRKHYENARAELEDLLQRELDYIHSEHNFGETIRFIELYHKLETQPGVDGVYMLTLHPAPGTDAVMQGTDIVLGESSLCYLGQLTLEINTSLAR